MKRITIVASILMALGLTSIVRAQSFVDLEARHANDAWNPSMKAWGVHPIDQKNALTVWALTSRTWGETLVGYQRTVAPWCRTGFGVGLETHKNLWRVNPWFWVGKGRLSAYGTFEEGASGFWYLTKGGVKIHNRLTVGVYSRKFVGTGGYTEIQCEKRTSALAAVTRYQDKTQVTLALHRTF